jgi:hypothetical protein
MYLEFTTSPLRLWWIDDTFLEGWVILCPLLSNNSMLSTIRLEFVAHTSVDPSKMKSISISVTHVFIIRNPFLPK